MVIQVSEYKLRKATMQASPEYAAPLVHKHQSVGVLALSAPQAGCPPLLLVVSFPQRDFNVPRQEFMSIHGQAPDKVPSKVVEESLLFNLFPKKYLKSLCPWSSLWKEAVTKSAFLTLSKLGNSVRDHLSINISSLVSSSKSSVNVLWCVKGCKHWEMGARD